MLELSDAVIYDIETYPNAFTLHAEKWHSGVASTWQISHYRDDRLQLFQFFTYLAQHQIPMIGFNNLHFDYPVIHWLYKNSNATVEQIYQFAVNIITTNSPFSNQIWESDRFAPQIDLFKIHHFDNRAKSTSLKALQINMRSKNVIDTPIELGKILTQQEIEQLLIPYNINDVKETKQFANYTRKAIEFRNGLRKELRGDVMNFNDTKIGAKILEQRLGEDICYTVIDGRKSARQTIRSKIALADIIFPYIGFSNPEFNRVLEYMRAQVLTPDDLDDPDATIKTKGVFTDLRAHVGGIDFHFGTGGVHASVPAQVVRATDEYIIRDIDVEGLYPAIAIVNKLAPEHLGERFTVEYAKIPQERKKHKKGTVENASLKLAANGTYGNSNNKFSIFYDPQYTMATTINGQLMLCMLAEWLTRVPTLQLIQVNTDGITYRIHKSHEPQAAAICQQWEEYTLLKLEDADYSAMWIRDVNNYVAKTTKGKLKQKGAYWHPDPANYAESISESSPPAWHKDLSALIVVRAAVVAMTEGIPPEIYIRAHTDPYDFMCRAKVDRSSKLMLGERQIQSTSRYYVALEGAELRKISPPAKGAQIGEYKRKNGVSDAEYERILAEIAPGTHDERIHTKNKSKYETREMSIVAGWKVAECNNAADFRFNNLNYEWYIQEAKKLVIT